MALKLKWTALALRDLEEIREYIHRDKPSAAKKEAQRIRHSVQRLLRFPRSGKALELISQVFELVSGNYRVFYRLGDHQVEILRVYHAKRSI